MIAKERRRLLLTQPKPQNRLLIGFGSAALVMLLVAYAIFLVKHPHEADNIKTTTGNIQKITTAIELYNGEMNEYPPTGLVTMDLFARHGAKPSEFIEDIPKTPKSHSLYQYDTDGNGRYTIIDPDTYESLYLNGFQRASPPVNGITTFEGHTCSANCSHIGYASQNNLFAY